MLSSVSKGARVLRCRRADGVEGWLLEHVVLPNFTAFGWSLNYRLPPEVR